MIHSNIAEWAQNILRSAGYKDRNEVTCDLTGGVDIVSQRVTEANIRRYREFCKKDIQASYKRRATEKQERDVTIYGDPATEEEIVGTHVLQDGKLIPRPTEKAAVKTLRLPKGGILSPDALVTDSLDDMRCVTFFKEEKTTREANSALAYPINIT